jgi:two-component system, NtrC family, sensor kinase
VLAKVQPQYKKDLSDSYFEVVEDHLSADLAVGSFDYLKKTANHQKYKILISESENIESSELLDISKNSRLYIIEQQNTQKLVQTLAHIKNESQKAAQVKEVKAEIQKKRKALELLTLQLSSESEKKIESLEKSHIEETEKNQNEKSLLHFLDFVQSESVGDDFIEKVFRFIWKDLKKQGRINLIGLSVTTQLGKAKILFYDGVGSSTTSAQIEFADSKVSKQLATIWGRPVGKIISWQLPEISRESYLFLEVVDHQLNLEKINSYFNERLPVLSMYLDRWMIQKEIEVVVDRWKNTFQSFSGYTHVVDENFKIYQGNYPHQSGDDCYKVLAGRTSPCESCPVLKNRNTNFVLKEDISVKTYFSQFKFQSKNYYFVIYEDITKLNLLQSHIIQTEKMSTLGRLGNHLAHELNNPLTGIKSYVQTLLDDNQVTSQLPATAKTDLNEILKAAVRCQKIIKNFIDFSQKKEPLLEPIAFSEVLQNTLVLLKTALRSHRLFIDLKNDNIMANAHDLQQVLFNLIKNSCQEMTETGSIKIYQEVKEAKIYFHIEDTGKGFSETILKNIFQPFMTTKEQGEGTGLGLYLSKKLMNNMNADLQITASSQKGAKISLIFDKLA